MSLIPNAILFSLLFLIPKLTEAQLITVKQLLHLQKSTPLTIQDFLETNSWKLKDIKSLREVDSAVFESSIATKILKNPSYIKNIDLEEAAWLDFESTNDLNINNTKYVNTVTVGLPSFMVMRAIASNKQDLKKHFQCTIDYTYFGDTIHTKILNEISSLEVSPDSSSIETNKKTVYRNYRLKEQIIELVTFNINSPVRMYTLSITSKSDFYYIYKK